MFETSFLYPILDMEVSRSGDCEQDFRDACKSGIKIIQLRAKKASLDKLTECAQLAREISQKDNVKLIINDWPDVAKSVDADGVHVGKKDMSVKNARKILGPGKIIGCSAENLEEALSAEKEGADYVGVGAIFPTPTKKDIAVVGLDELKRIKEKVKIPLVAIGGINSKNFTRVLDTGVGMIAVISDIFMAESVQEKIKEYQERYKEYVRTIDY